MGVSEDYFPFPQVGYVSSLEGNILGGGLKDFFFYPDTWGDDPIWLYNIFEIGWNHQLAKYFTLAH